MTKIKYQKVQIHRRMTSNQKLLKKNIKCCGGCTVAECLTQEHIISVLRSAGTLLSDGQYKLDCGSHDLQQPIRAGLGPESEQIYWSRRRRPEGRWVCVIIKLTNPSGSCWCCKWPTCHRLSVFRIFKGAVPHFHSTVSSLCPVQR